MFRKLLDKVCGCVSSRPGKGKQQPAQEESAPIDPNSPEAQLSEEERKHNELALRFVMNALLNKVQSEEGQSMMSPALQATLPIRLTTVCSVERLAAMRTIFAGPPSQDAATEAHRLASVIADECLACEVTVTPPAPMVEVEEVSPQAPAVEAVAEN